MENNATVDGSSLDKFLSKITSDVVRTALDKVSDAVEIDDVESFLEPLNDESFKGSLVETCSLHSEELTVIKTEDISNAYIHERCSKLIEDTFTEVYDELQRIFESNSQEMSNDIESSEKKLQLIECLKDSDRLQAYFHELSMSIIQNTLDKMTEKGKHMEPYLDDDMESDITTSIKPGSESNTEQNFKDNIDKNDIDHNYEVSLEDENSFIAENQPTKDDSESFTGNKCVSIDSGRINSASTSGFTTANSTMYQTTEGEPYNGESMNQDSFFSAKNETDENSEHTTVDSTMFTTANDSQENSNTFSSFEKELPQDITMMTPGRLLISDIDTTLTSGPRQSTPLVDEQSNSHEITLSSNEILPQDSQPEESHASLLQSTPLKDREEESETSLLSEASHVLANVPERKRSIQEFSGDESSLGDPSSPRTISRQSSMFGNVTLEFETDWEASMKGMREEDEIKPGYEEKHKVILHELSFEDSHRLKAPELLCPVFLAVQDDDDNEDMKKMKKMSQSIDDLCEMISEDTDDDQDLPLRRRAMSLEGKRPPPKDHRKKAPTREELIAAFEELQHEMMEDKEMDDEEEQINEEDDEQDRIREGEMIDTQEQSEERSELDDPLRWHTVVFNGQHKVIDLKLLEPFLKVLTHGGYHHDGEKKTVIVVLTACNLPDKKMKRYPFLMEQLFFFIISTMDLLVTSEEYIFVYFHGGTSKNQSPSFSWLKKYYQYIDHRLRKSVTKVFVVHPNLWLKSVFRLCRPFLSSNFARKLKFVSTLKELSSHIKTDFIYIPDEVVRVDPDYRRLHTS